MFPANPPPKDRVMKKNNSPKDTGLEIKGVKIIEGTKLTSESIHFESDEDITRASRSHLTVFYWKEKACFCVRHSKTKRFMPLSRILDGWKVTIFDVKQ